MGAGLGPYHHLHMDNNLGHHLKQIVSKPKPFSWTADPDAIIAAVRRGHQTLDSHRKDRP
ncbi:hypothetical protein GCM10011505_39420 [Tistrella bauzanensis]|uniref:Transposase n=1 Tax=Tistrella bauzanensis TaxID=657419 RepID=A0ABQ1IXR3_9PROT|nr:hypothetical protein GCM10011505_39420 [Tistrella bauzanensis]